MPIIYRGHIACLWRANAKENEKNFALFMQDFAHSKKLLHRKSLILHSDSMAWHVQSCEQVFVYVPVVCMTVQGVYGSWTARN